MKYIILILLLTPLILLGQKIPNESNLIIVKGIKFIDVCNSLLDSGYVIEKKDSELGTIKTELRQYEKYWNSGYYFQIRVRDSIGYFKCYFTGPLTSQNPLFKDERCYYMTNKKGVFQEKSLFGYPFMVMFNFLKSLGGEIECKIE